MSLTEREKEIALECESKILEGLGCVERYDLFLSRIREEQETRSGYECVHCGMIYPDHPVSACDCLEAGQKQAFHNVVISRIPPATLPSGNRSECDCSELVEALERTWEIIDAAKLHNLVNGVQLGQIAWLIKMEEAKEESLRALVKHKASMGEK